jgi:hypothetical protein
MKKNVKTGDEINELPGQLFKDLVQLKNEDFCCTRWSFDARAADYPNGAAGIGNKIVELAKKNEASLRKAMKFENNEVGQSQWEEFIEELSQNTSKIVEVKAI